MRIKWTISGVAIALLPLSVVFPQSAAAQVNLQVQIAVPTIRFETAPVLVQVTPSVQVVEDYDQEVFFVDGWYWYRSGPTWYQTRNHRGGWVVVHERSVPPTLVHIPRGKYKHYRGRGPHANEHRRDAEPRGRDVRFKHQDRKDHNDHKDRGKDKDRKDHKDHKDSKHGRR